MQIVLKFLCASLMVVSSLAMASREIDTKDFSGWLDDYDSLVYVEERNAFLFVNKDKRGIYSKIMVDDVEIHTVNAEKNGEIAERAADYLTSGIEDLLVRKGLAADGPGPEVVRLQIAVTGTEKSKEGLKAHNLIPVSALFRGAKEVTGKVSTYIDTMFEAQMVDSVTGERVMAIVSKGIEETEKTSGDEFVFEDIVPTLDKWLAQYEITVDEYLANRQ